MALQIVGAGLGRTGTHSLKLALEHLLGKPCYHMTEVFEKPEHVRAWRAAVHGETPDWDLLFAGYAAAVDWPAAAFFEPLMDAYPDAVVLLSTRADAEAWWRSAHATIFSVIDKESDMPADLERMVLDLFDIQFTPHWRDHDASVAAYERHNETVRAKVPPERLLEWTPADGWDPICRVLGCPTPDSPFPHVNTTADFRAMTGLDAT